MSIALCLANTAASIINPIIAFLNAGSNSMNRQAESAASISIAGTGTLFGSKV
jgi:hypothetical protein